MMNTTNGQRGSLIAFKGKPITWFLQGSNLKSHRENKEIVYHSRHTNILDSGKKD